MRDISSSSRAGFGIFLVFLKNCIGEMASGSQAPHHSSDEDILEEDPPKQRPESVVWTFFTFPAGEKKVNARKVTCLLCDRVLSRGSDKKYSCGTASMYKHLRTIHPKNLAREEMRRAAKNPPPGIASTSGASTSAPPVDIRPEFAFLQQHCTKCKTIICYGEQSVDAICAAQRNHKSTFIFIFLFLE